MGRGKGAIPYRKIDRILKESGYLYVRDNGHKIYQNNNGDIIAIPKTCCTYLIKRLFKEHNIKECN